MDIFIGEALAEKLSFKASPDHIIAFKSLPLLPLNADHTFSEFPDHKSLKKSVKKLSIKSRTKY